MKNWKNKFLACTAASMLLLSRSMTVLAVSEADVEAAGKEAASGNLLIWFLCAIAFLKVSQKIDSFMGSLGINVGHTGGSMITELMVAARGITTVKNISGGGSFHGGSFHGGGSSNSVNNASFLSGGLAGAVGRQFAQSAMQTMTGQSSNPISRRAFESSVKKGGDFANSVTGAVAQGNINYTGSMTGRQAAQALTSYMGQTGIPDAPSYSGVEIGGGRIMGTETSVEHPKAACGTDHKGERKTGRGAAEPSERDPAHPLWGRNGRGSSGAFHGCQRQAFRNCRYRCGCRHRVKGCTDG